MTSLDKQIKKLEKQKKDLIRESIYCPECDKYYHKHKWIIKTSRDYFTIDYICPKGHLLIFDYD